MNFQIVSAWDSTSPLNPFAMITSKESPLYKSLNFRLLKMMEAGIVSRSLSVALKKDPNCKPLRKTVPSLGLNKAGGLFVWLSFGFVLSAVIFIFERVKAPTANIKKTPRLDEEMERLMKLQDILQTFLSMEKQLPGVPWSEILLMLSEVKCAKERHAKVS